MSFTGKRFVFDGISSTQYNLVVGNKSGGDIEIDSGSNVTIYEEEIYGKSKPYFYGATPSGKLSFSLLAFSPEPISARKSSRLMSWLFGQKEYKVFQIVQGDMKSVYFNAFLQSPKTWRVGNQVMGYTFDVVCDSPYAYEFPKTFERNYTSGDITDNFEFYNDSDNIAFLYPNLILEMDDFGGDISIVNASDDNRELSFTGLSANEIITINNNLGIITSSVDLKRMSNFNKKFFRLVPSVNELTISGNIHNFTMTYQFSRSFV